MKRRSLLVFLVIGILWVGSLAVVGFIVAPDIPLEQNPQTKDYNSSKSNTTSIQIIKDEDGFIRIGILQRLEDGTYQMGTHSGDSVTFSFNPDGSVAVSEPKSSTVFDGLVEDALNEALSMWAYDSAMGIIPNIR